MNVYVRIYVCIYNIYYRLAEKNPEFSFKCFSLKKCNFLQVALIPYFLKQIMLVYLSDLFLLCVICIEYTKKFQVTKNLWTTFLRISF